MRHQWRLLLLRNYSRSTLRTPSQLSHFQVNSRPLHSLSSLLNNHSSQKGPQQCNLIELKNPINTLNSVVRGFSTEPVVEEIDSDHLVVTDVFSRFSDVTDIKKELESNGFVISHEWVLKVLRGLESNPGVARRFFEWVLESNRERVSSKTYNLMLGALGINGFVEEFWNLVDFMQKNKGHGVSGRVRDKVSEKFEKDGLENDLKRLRGLFVKDPSVEKVSSSVCAIVRNEIWSEDVEKRLRDLNLELSSDLVKMVLEKLATEPAKALIYFRWVEESALFKHDEQTYNAIARVLGREDCLDRFWKVVDEMRHKGCEMEMDTYVKVSGRFCNRKMIKEAVDLYEFALAGVNKPSVQSFTFLLQKIVVAKQLDMNLFSKLVKAFTGNGNVLTESMLRAVLKSLRSVSRLGESNKILKEMEEGGLVVGEDVRSRITFWLNRAGVKDETTGSEQNTEASGDMWELLVEEHCEAGNLEMASDSFRKMVEKQGVSNAAHAFERLVNAYCNENRAIDACKLLLDYDKKNQLKPWHNTYKLLIKKLLTKKAAQGGFKDALNLLSLMKNHGFPPFTDPFIQYLSKSGNSDEAFLFLKARSSKKTPSLSLALSLFEAFLKASRHDEAQDLLSKCPGYISNNADVLNLFYSLRSDNGVSVAAVLA